MQYMYMYATACVRACVCCFFYNHIFSSFHIIYFFSIPFIQLCSYTCGACAISITLTCQNTYTFMRTINYYIGRFSALIDIMVYTYVHQFVSACICKCSLFLFMVVFQILTPLLIALICDGEDDWYAKGSKGDSIVSSTVNLFVMMCVRV